MLSKVTSFSLYGLEGFAVDVEVDVSNGLPAFEIVGLPDAAVKESKERVRSAIKNSGRHFPTTKITVNLAPADMKKEGAYLDLAIAVGIIKAVTNDEEFITDKYIFLGELSLDGTLRKVNGILPMLISAKNMGYTKFIIPKINEKEASYINNVEVFAMEHLTDVVSLLNGSKIFDKVLPKNFGENKFKEEYTADLKYVKGQAVAKRALEVAVSGGHNLIMVGPPGTGKTMLAKCIPTIMPDMTFEEALETTKIHSVSGILKEDEGIVYKRPFLTPHHTASNVSLVGGGQNVKPGIISLAHNGVLYLDEMPEYTRVTLECLRQPLEDRVITVSRAKANVEYPANFILCASMNPCPCGNYGSKNRECKCTPQQIKKYKSKISGPLLDRIDLSVEVDSVDYSDLTSTVEEEPSSVVKKRVDRARAIQRERFKDEKILTNSEMGESHIQKYCKLSSKCEEVLKFGFETLNLSARARSRVIKVARTIADLDLSEFIKPDHILEALSYRSNIE